MGDWWLDETPPRDSITDSEWWERLPSNWGTWFHSGRIGTLTPASMDMLKKYEEKLQREKLSVRASGSKVVASAGTHTFGGIYHLHGIIIDEAEIEATFNIAETVDVQINPPAPNPDKGRINNTGPRRGSAFGRGGKKCY